MAFLFSVASFDLTHLSTQSSVPLGVSPALKPSCPVACVYAFQWPLMTCSTLSFCLMHPLASPASSFLAFILLRLSNQEKLLASFVDAHETRRVYLKIKINSECRKKKIPLKSIRNINQRKSLSPDTGCQELKNHQDDKENTIYRIKQPTLKEKETYGRSITSVSWENCLFNRMSGVVMFLTVWDMKFIIGKENS